MIMDQKKRLSQQQEFDIMKLVLDKFLWLGFAIMAYGLWLLLQHGFVVVRDAILMFVAGAIVLVLFLVLIVREYEIIK